MRLRPGQVHVWCARLDAQVLDLAACRASLSDEERARADRLRVPGAARRFTAARARLRDVLGDYLSIPAKDVRLAVAPGGKPYVPGVSLHFSVSHSADLLIVAVGGAPLGVDVEDLRRHVNMMAIARRFFTAEEAAALDRQPAAGRARAFYRLWTRKEAVLKARGVGFAQPLQSVPVSIEPGVSSSGGWRLADLDVDGDAVAALATLGAAEVIEREMPPWRS
jgi:4'-phosphopantetheinyl transferase